MPVAEFGRGATPFQLGNVLHQFVFASPNLRRLTDNTAKQLRLNLNIIE